MESTNVILFVFDEEEHFNKNLNNLGKDSFKKIIRIDSKESLKSELELLEKNSVIHLVVHIFYSDNIKGIQQFISSGIREEYPLLDTRFISDGNTSIIKQNMSEKEISYDDKMYLEERLQKYFYVRTSIENNEVKLHSVKEHLNIENDKGVIINDGNVDYVIITALEEDEMEKVLPLITKLSKVPNDKHLINIGYFNSKPEKKVVYASQISTGMIDASILATELIIRFNPKFVIMTGVLGGKPEKTNLGDVVISNKVFTIDKGKLTATQFQHEIESTNTTSSHSTEILREKKNIIDFIESEDDIYNRRIDIHFEPVACVRHVIDKEGYFVENISTIDRKSIGLEMESYGIARACEIVNNGKTIPLIIKSVMDNTQDKTDGAKKLAAWTSAKVLEYIIKNDIL
jgi:nucleoside phosphorylase